MINKHTISSYIMVNELWQSDQTNFQTVGKTILHNNIRIAFFLLSQAQSPKIGVCRTITYKHISDVCIEFEYYIAGNVFVDGT